MFTHKLVIGFWLLVISLFITPAAFAQASTPSAIPTTVSPTSPIYTDLLVHNMFHTFSCLAVGQSVIGQPCLNYVQGVPVLSKVNMQGGTLGAVTGLIGGLYQNPPVRTTEYLASVGQGLGLVKEANAQVVGSGQAVLDPIIKLWQVSRNISYVIMIVIFVVIGIMVMFRQRINPQTVITAQAAIPGLVIGLILITFSYFLAGLISDTAFIGTNMVGYYFAAAQGKADDPDRLNLVEKISGTNVLKIFGNFAGIITTQRANDAFNSVYKELTDDAKSAVDWFAGFMGFQFAGQLGGITGPYAAIAGPVLGLLGGLATRFNAVGIIGWLLHFAATFILVYAMLRLLLRLINSYLTIIFLTITAPFQFLFASLPGRQGIATAWIMDLLGNILVFPAVIAVFYFVAIILGPANLRPDFPLKISEINQIKNNTSTVYAQEPIDIVKGTTFPLFGGMDLDFIKILLSFGALVALPAIPDIVVRTVGKASEAGQLIGQEISGGVRGGQGYFSQHTGRLTQAGQSISTGIAGESQYQFVEGEPKKYTTRAGLLQVGGNLLGRLRGKSGGGGAGRT